MHARSHLAERETMRRAVEKIGRSEQLEPEEVAALLFITGVTVMAGAVLAARVLKPLVDRLAAMDPSAWFEAPGSETPQVRLN